LFHAEEGWVSATSENMSLHVDMQAKRTAPFPDRLLGALGRMQAAHAYLPRPQAAGRAIAMRGKTPDNAFRPLSLFVALSAILGVRFGRPIMEQACPISAT
jgi:hypothetical protein